MKEFKPLSEYLESQSKENTFSKNRVLKNPIVDTSRRVTVEMSTDLSDHDQSDVQAIFEDGEIVGMIHRCSCGRIAEIRFNYASP